MLETNSQKNSSQLLPAQHVDFEFFKTVSTMVTSAFALVAALAWNETISQIFLRFRPQNNLFYWLGYAIVVTLIAVFVTFQMKKVAQRFGSKKEASNGSQN